MNRHVNMILTIGHSNHPMEMFLGLLARHRVIALADVRSSPYSRFNPQFNREQLHKSLRLSGISYVFLGRELGGRSDDPFVHENGRIRYDQLARTEGFRNGLERLLRGAARFRVAIMCSEMEPLKCHRTLLVGHELDKRGIDVGHILADGRLEMHAAAMSRLLAEFKLDTEYDLFMPDAPRGELIAEAIARQSARFGHAREHSSDKMEKRR